MTAVTAGRGYPRDWHWFAQLDLIEEYHHMVDLCEVELQRDGDRYWIDPIDLTDTKSVIAGDVILAAIANAGRFNRATAAGLSTAGTRTATSSTPPSRSIDPAILSPKTFDPQGTRSDAATWDPYVVVSQNGSKTKMPLVRTHGE